MSASNKSTIIELRKTITTNSQERKITFSSKSSSSQKINKLISESLEEFSNNALANCFENSKAHILLNEALAQGDIKVEFSWPIKDQLAHWEPATRTIRLFNDYPVLSKGQFSSCFNRFLFELCNSTNPYFDKSKDESELLKPKNFDTAEQYAKMMEIAEFAGTLYRYQEVFQHAKKENLWPDVKMEHENLDSFETTWKYVNKKSKGRTVSHFERYKSQFEKLKQESETNQRDTADNKASSSQLN